MKSGTILLCKRDIFSRQAAEIARALLGGGVEVLSGKVGDPMPSVLETAQPGRLVSFLSPWIIPQRILDRADLAINFHPGSVDYPGTGCYNFALYENAKEFGATCHHMLAKVDTGLLVEERRFPILGTDTVEILKLRTMVTMLSMFHDICALLAQGKTLPLAATHWTKRPYTRREMNALKELLPTMDQTEIERRVRATTYPGYPGPFMVRDGQTVRYPVPDRAPIA